MGRGERGRERGEGEGRERGEGRGERGKGGRGGKEQCSTLVLTPHAYLHSVW